MHKHSRLLEWQILEKQDEWEAVLRAPAVDSMPSAPTALHRLHRYTMWGGALALLLLLASAGGWLWHTAQAGLDQIEGEISSAVQLELETVAQGLEPLAASRATDPTALAWQSQLERELKTLQTALPSGIAGTQLTTGLLTTGLRVLNLQDELASVDFVTSARDGAQAYRQTRFYRQTADGWQRSEPDAKLWGSPHRLESSHFIFHFRQNDAEVIAAVAPKSDALYTELLRNFALTPNSHKLVIEVTVERTTGAIPTPRWDRQALIVPSPALYLAPVELSDQTILMQSIAIPLIDYMIGRMTEEHAISEDWRPLLNGIQLWQLWNLETPLAQWRYDIVKWLFIDFALGRDKQHSVVPDTYAQFCSVHHLWMLSPLYVGIPVECTEWESATWPPTWWVAHLPRTRFAQLTMPQIGRHPYYDQEIYLHGSGEPVKAAILVEYAVAAYGYEQLPDLLTGMAHYDSWDSLLAAVYGVSTAEFEAGWREYLVQEYGAAAFCGSSMSWSLAPVSSSAASCV